MDNSRANITFHYSILNIVNANNHLAYLTPLISNQYPVIDWQLFELLIYNIQKYSRSIKDISRIENFILKKLNPDIQWKDLCDIIDVLAHKYHDIILLLYINIHSCFIPIMKILPNIQLPDYLNLPQDLPEILSIDVNANLLDERNFDSVEIKDAYEQQKNKTTGNALPHQPPGEKQLADDQKAEPDKTSSDLNSRPTRPPRP
ncbi:MAG: hypothetical protein LBW85_05175 [Deltaproteobacteria bacterium]|jgi:hypothetical protein|nr:hypothetical protein [Deltaproteobacteria bacterium]